jgi:hypothetical protein
LKWCAKKSPDSSARRGRGENNDLNEAIDAQSRRAEAGFDDDDDDDDDADGQ